MKTRYFTHITYMHTAARFSALWRLLYAFDDKRYQLRTSPAVMATLIYHSISRLGSRRQRALHAARACGHDDALK